MYLEAPYGGEYRKLKTTFLELSTLEVKNG
jgi:hypothetical protein